MFKAPCHRNLLPGESLLHNSNHLLLLILRRLPLHRLFRPLVHVPLPCLFHPLLCIRLQTPTAVPFHLKRAHLPRLHCHSVHPTLLTLEHLLHSLCKPLPCVPRHRRFNQLLFLQLHKFPHFPPATELSHHLHRSLLNAHLPHHFLRSHLSHIRFLSRVGGSMN
jgi:hypothetical protein